jgi:hypothetical protein
MVKGYSKEVEVGKTYYEIEGMNGKSSLDVLYLPDGTLVEVEEGVAPADLPAPVKAAAGMKYPKGKISKAEKTTRERVVSFELRVLHGNTRSELVVDQSGKILKESHPNAKREEKKD